MDMSDKLTLQRMHAKLRNSLACDGDLLAELVAAGLLSPEDKRHVAMGTNHMQRDPQDKTDVLLEMLPHLGKDAFDEFCAVLAQSPARRNRELAEELCARKLAPDAYQGRAVTETIIERPATGNNTAFHAADPLEAALRRTAWTDRHTDVLLEVLGTAQLHRLMSRLTQAFPVQCTDANGRLEVLPQSRVGAETVKPTSESDHVARQCSADSREYRDAVVIKPNHAPLSFNVARPPASSDTDYDPWTSEVYLSCYRSLLEVLPPDRVRPIAMARRAITDQQHKILTARSGDDHVGHNELLIQCVKKSGDNSYATLIAIINELGPNFFTVCKELEEALVRRPAH